MRRVYAATLKKRPQSKARAYLALELMTSEQFELLARLLRSRGASREGCRLVLVDGMRQCDAARKLDVAPVLIAVAIKHYRVTHDAILEAYCCL